jgi:hypothetical protein
MTHLNDSSSPPPSRWHSGCGRWRLLIELQQPCCRCSTQAVIYALFALGVGLLLQAERHGQLRPRACTSARRVTSDCHPAAGSKLMPAEAAVLIVTLLGLHRLIAFLSSGW